MLAAALALASFPLVHTASLSSRQTQLQWSKCDPSWPIGNHAVVCSTVQVPFDYNNPGAGTATLALAKLPATATKLGTIFANTGDNGLNFLGSTRGGRLFNMTGRAFDIIAWDSRGTGMSAPAINCFDKVEAGTLGTPASTFFTTSLANNASLSIKSTGPIQDDIERFLGRTSAAESIAKDMFQSCASKHSGFLQYLGAAATTRDLVTIADAVQGSGSSINYYGASYGSIIGVYLMRLYPQRLGKIVVDGIIDAFAYTTRPGYLSYGVGFVDAAPSLNVFLEACAQAGPPSSPESSGCALARQGSTSWDIQQRINKLIDDMYELSRRGFGTFTPLEVYNTLQGLLSTPTYWHIFAFSLSALETEIEARLSGNFTESSFKRGLAERQTELADHIVDKSLSAGLASECGDGPDAGNTTTGAMFDETVRVTRDIAGLVGPVISMSPWSYCHLWPVRSVERLTLPSEIEIPGSVLIIGNTYDSVSPLENAANLFRRIKAKGTKRLVQHDAVGHTSLHQRSACTQDVVRRYFAENILPGSDVRCGVNEAPSFPPPMGSPPEPSSTNIISAPIGVPTGPAVSSARPLAGLTGVHIGATVLISMVLLT